MEQEIARDIAAKGYREKDFPYPFSGERILRKPGGFLKERSDPQLEQEIKLIV